MLLSSGNSHCNRKNESEQIRRSVEEKWEGGKKQVLQDSMGMMRDEKTGQEEEETRKAR